MSVVARVLTDPLQTRQIAIVNIQDSKSVEIGARKPKLLFPFLRSFGWAESEKSPWTEASLETQQKVVFRVEKRPRDCILLRSGRPLSEAGS